MIDGIRYVRAVRRHARLVVATALVAVVLTILMLFFLPQRYRATADVVVILPDVQTGSLIATTAQSVSDFEGALRTAAVARAAAQASGLPAGSISDGLRTEWLEGGSVVEVTFTGPDPGSAETAVSTASREAILFLLRARLAPITHRQDNAQAAMAAAVQALEDFKVENRLIDIDEYLDDQQAKLEELQNALDQAQADGDTDQAERIDARMLELAQATSAIRSQHSVLDTARAQAFNSLIEARAASDTAEGAVEAAADASSIKVLAAEPVPRTERLPSQLLVVVVVATALTIGLIVLLELLTPRQRASSSDRRDRPLGGPSPAPVERRRAGSAPPAPVRTLPGGAATRGVAGGRAPTGDGNSSPSASRAAPVVDASTTQQPRPVAPSSGRTSPANESASRRPAEVREDSALRPRPPSRPDHPVMGGAALAPRPVASPSGTVGPPAPEGPRRGSVEPVEGRTTLGRPDATASSPRVAEGSARTEVTTDRAPIGDRGNSSPQRTGGTNRSSKKRKKRNRRPTDPNVPSTSPAAPTATPPGSASEGDDRTERGTPAAPSGGGTGSASAERTDRPTAASKDGDSSGEGSAPRAEDPGPSLNA